MAIAIGCPLMAVILLVGMLARGLALAQLWDWFIVPLGVTPITVPWALGIGVVAHLFYPAHTSDDDARGVGIATATLKVFLLAVGGPLLALAAGWLFHSWM